MQQRHGLLSPHRGRQGDPQLHDGTIITAAPHVMWGTDGVRVFTVDDGWVWTFAAVDHWNAECVGWHVCKVGNRFAALEPIAHGLRQRYGSVDADVARGLALRMDHGSQYLSDHFLHQIRYWGIRPSFGFLEEPETNGVAERWNRTLKEQAIYGRVFQRLDDVRAAVADGVGARMRAGLRASNRRARHLPMRYETGLPSSVIRFRTLHASTASRRCPDALRARRQSPTIDVYRKNAFSTRACGWSPDAFLTVAVRAPSPS